MPKKRKAPPSSSTSKRGPDRQFVGGEPTAPTKKEWENMTQFKTFVVLDDMGAEHRFSLQAYALVLPEGADPKGSLRLRDYWVGKIREIRARNLDPTEVWVSTQWLMSAEDLLQHKKLDVRSFGKMERVLSNHFDFVHTSCFADIANVQAYVESDTEPPPIGDETFFYRSTFDVFSRELKPVPSPTCFCGRAYNPSDSSIMHFCPRKSCCKSFHAECLRKSNFVEKPRRSMRALQEQRGLQFERTIADSPTSSEEASPVSPAPTSSSRQVVRSHARKQLPTPVEDRRPKLPPELLELARSPMVKGQGTDLPFEWSCVTGNVAVVTRARRLVREFVEDETPLPLKWQSFLEIPGEDGDDIGSDVIRAWAVSDEMFLCPGCKGAI